MVEEKSFFEELESEKPESFNEEVFVATKSKKPMYIGFALVFVLILFFGFNLMNKVEVPEMSTWDVSEVNAWAKKNKITLIGKQKYDGIVALDHVMNQGIEAGAKIKRNGSIEVTFSKGADPEEKIDFPDLKTMNLNDIRAWVDTNKLTGINIQYENSNTIDKGALISVEFVDGDEISFIRKNRVKVTVSKGTKELTETLKVPDFYGKTKQEVLKWSVDNKVSLVIEEVYSDYVEANYVISQDVPKDNKINRTDEVTVEISKGQPISVPNFMNLTSSEATALAALYDLRLFIKSVPSSGEVDRIVYQSLQVDSQAKKNDIITLHVSKNTTSIIMPDLRGMSKSEASEILGVYNVKVIYKTVDSTEEKTSIINQSVASGNLINENDVITLTVSGGNIQVPDFEGMSKLKAEALAEDLGLNILFNPVVNVHLVKDQIIKQDIEENKIVENGTRITLDVSVNKGIKVVNLTSMTKVEAEFWAESKGFKLRVIDVYSSNVKKNQLFDQNYVNIYLPETEPIIVYNSLGKVSVGNHVGQTKEQVEEWVTSVNEKGGNITVEYRNVKSTTYEKGQITNHTPKNELIELDGKVVFYVCSSQVKSSPETSVFESMTEAEFIRWCDNNDITYKINEVYNSDVKVGYVFGDNLRKVVSKGEILQVKKSLGSVPVQSFVGKSKSELEHWLSGINNKDGNISVKYIEQAGGVKDTITSQSVVSGLLDVASTITVTISTGL